jgi:hypothetical protein
MSGLVLLYFMNSERSTGSVLKVRVNSIDMLVFADPLDGTISMVASLQEEKSARTWAFMKRHFVRIRRINTRLLPMIRQYICNTPSGKG